MIRKIFIIIAIFLSMGIAQATDYVIISEILYDSPLNEDPSKTPYCFGEFIELYNAGSEPANLTGWQLTISETGQTYTFPDVVLTSKYFLIVTFGTPDAYGDFICQEERAEGMTDFHMVFNIYPDTNVQILYQTQMMLPNETCTLLLKDYTGKTRDYIKYGDNPSWNTVKASNIDYASIHVFSERNNVNAVQRTYAEFDIQDCCIFHEYNWIGGKGEWDRDSNYIESNSPMYSQKEIKTNIGNIVPPKIPILNYIVTVCPTVEMESIPTTNNKMELNNLDAIVKIDYFDGLGRPLQTMQKAFTPLKKNLITYTEYDGYGRTAKEWLPVVVDFDYMELYQLSEESKLLYPNESRAYTEYRYSADRFSNRVLRDELIGIQAPGADMNNHYAARKTLPYEDNSVKCYRINNDMPQVAGNYKAKTLIYEQSTDEDGKVSRTYKNKQGQVIMTRQSTNVDTYYVYNDLGQLAFVLPPLAADAGGTADAIDKYGYAYKYDDRGNCIYKKLPGCELVYMVYDRADRLVLSQDGNQRNRIPKQWTFNKYDEFGRLIITGVFDSGQSQSYFIQKCKDIVVTEVYNGGSYGYSWSKLPEIPYAGTLIVNYYDDYDRIEQHSGIPAQLRYEEKQGYSIRYINEDLGKKSAKGLLVGTRTRILDGSGETVTAYYYDYRGNVIQTRSTNHLGGYDIVYGDLDFTGKPNKTLTEHNVTNCIAVTELYKYTYDHAGRLIETRYKINKKDEIVLSKNEYDELGRLVKKKRHNENDTEEYAYNIRNWTTRIKSGTTFEENLYYTSAPDNLNASSLFNGNIAVATWKYNGQLNGYKYSYDALNRLSGSSAIINGVMSDYQMAESFTYDKHGNILYLSRWDNQDEPDALHMSYNGNRLIKVTDWGISQHLYSIKEYQDLADTGEDMAYDANGNLIKDLDRDIVTIRYNLLNLPELIQFRNGNQIKNTYAADGRKLYVHLVTLAPGVFNPLNPGQVIDGLDVNELEIVTVTGTDYVNNKEYAVSRYFDWDATYKPKDLRSLQRTLNPEGYAMNATTISETSEASYHYYRRDHLGNNREVWRASYKWVNKVNPATTLQLTQYYPSGLPWKTNTGDSPSTQPYKYGGKEFVEAHGLDEYDSHARWYYPAIMRTTTLDPLAEKYYSISPYAWCGNNPVNRIDPDGRQWQRSRGAAASGAVLGWLISPARATTPLQMMQKDRLHIKAAHAVLDVGGMAPGVGEPADALNGLLYAIEGDRWNAGMSFAGTIPLLGWAATSAKWVSKGLRNVSKVDAGAVNKLFGKASYNEAFDVIEGVTKNDTKFVRVHGENNKLSSWMMDANEIKGLSPRQIKDKFALPELPTQISDIIVPSGTKIRVGVANSVEGWGKGGGVQIQILQTVQESWIKTTKILE